MNCSTCDGENPTNTPRCPHCGIDWPIATHSTQESLDRLRRYVPHVVAEGILHDQERLRGERREVAVLFADAVDFTHLSASLDAESVFEMINEVLSRLMICVHRYDGLVDKFTGDGLMAVFGAPIAHESDSELAVRAALDMQKAIAEFTPIARERLGAPLKIRIGIHCGPAIAGILGNETQAAYTVIGDTVNLAARLESKAQPGHILVSARVHQQTAPLFNFQSKGKTPLKGLDKPMEIYEVLSDRSEPLSTRGVTGVTSILLGRNTELEQLRGLLTTFLEENQYGKLVIIRGEAGIGKSRLVSEWLADIPDVQPAIWQGRGLPYAQGVGYGVFRSLLQDALRNHPPERAWDAHVSPALRPFLRLILEFTLTADEQRSLSYLEPERINQLSVLAMREWLLGEAQERPVILILDDFHWADALSIQALETLHSLTEIAPLLLCIVTRPQPHNSPAFLPPADAPPTANTRAINLLPLSPEHSHALLEHLVNLEGLATEVVETILTRAEGNPFYIEEFVRMLIEKEMLRLENQQWHVISPVALQAMEIPTTLRGLMMARVDRLAEDQRNVLSSAAVIGLQFNARLLEEVDRRLHGSSNTRAVLERLQEVGLLVERPEAGAHTYAFRHIITQETIYNSMLRSHRPELHRTVAEAIEYLHANDLHNQAEVLALHYDRAYARDKALDYAVLAGDRARTRFANHEAIEYYSRALQISQHLNERQSERWQSAIGLGEVYQHIGEYEEAFACYQAALEEWKQAVPETRAQALLRLGQVSDKRGDLQEAETWLRQGLALITQLKMPRPELRAQFLSELGWITLRSGKLDAAQQLLDDGLALVEGSEHYDVLGSILNRLGAIYYHHSEWAAAATFVERALDIRTQLGDIVGMARSYNNLAIVNKYAGKWEHALLNYQQSLELMQKIGEMEGLALTYTNLGVLYTERGAWMQAEEALQQSLAITQRITHPYELAQAHMNLGRLYLRQQRWDEAERHLNAALPLYEEAGAGANLNLNDVYELKGYLYTEQGAWDAAQTWAARSERLLREVTQTPEEAIEWGRYHLLMGRLNHAQKAREVALKHYKRSLSVFQDKGITIELGRAAYWLALLYHETAQPTVAQELLNTALEVFGRLGARPEYERARVLQEQL